MSDSTSNKSSRNALGRGLAALIPTAPAPGAQTAPAPTQPEVEAAPRTLAIERIQPNKSQPRKRFDKGALDELAASIKEQGILQPIVVHKSGAGYEIVAGERRWRRGVRHTACRCTCASPDSYKCTVCHTTVLKFRGDLTRLPAAQRVARHATHCTLVRWRRRGLAVVQADVLPNKPEAKLGRGNGAGAASNSGRRCPPRRIIARLVLRVQALVRFAVHAAGACRSNERAAKALAAAAAPAGLSVASVVACAVFVGSSYSRPSPASSYSS